MGEIVDHLDAAGTADRLEAPADTRKARERRRHVRQRYADRATGRDRGKRIHDIVRARHGHIEDDVLDAEAAPLRPEHDVLAAYIGVRGEAEAPRATGEAIEVWIVANDERLARPRAQRGEHGRNLVRLLVVALKVEDHAHGRRVAHQRAVALVGLHDEQI